VRIKAFVITLFTVVLFFSSAVFAQIRYCGINVNVDEKGKSVVEIILMVKGINNFTLNIFGHISNLSATSDNGDIYCTTKSNYISSISCNVTEESKNRLTFETNDFIKKKEFFSLSARLFFDIPVSHLIFSVQLPESANIVKIFPEPSFSSSSFIVWSDIDMAPEQEIEFEADYKIELIPAPSVIPWQHIAITAVIIFGISSGAILSILQRVKRPKEIILSVLDDYEKKVINAIVAAGGEINQKRIVQETNLSKAKVSRIVKDLVNRGIIEVQRLGRTNKIKLVKKKFEF